ncbi:MAG: hypothetical protein M0027_07140 [Candidatus Dormibacteraeota bacterium]|nr:hypothetical protein [Candidatus Dormibacteraeota bacterium]
MKGEALLGCLRFPHLRLLLAWRDHPELIPEAVVVSGFGPSDRMVVKAASEAAMAAGVHLGQDASQAEMASPGAVRLQDEHPRLEGVREQLLAVLYDFSPLVEIRGDSQVYLDLGGRDPRWATKAARASQLGRAVQRVLGVAPAVGVGQSRFVALAAARRAGAGRIRLVPRGAAPTFLSTWPVAELPLPPKTVAQLLGFGLLTCGDCLAIPLADLQRQLGPAALTLYRLCLGQDGAAINPRRKPPPCAVRKVLAGVVENTEALRFGAPELAAMLAQELARLGLACGRLRILLLDEDATGGELGLGQPGVFMDEITIPTPAVTAEDLLHPILSLLARARCRVLTIELQALSLTPPPQVQSQLWAVGDTTRDEIGRAVARLHERFGQSLVWRVGLRPGHPGDVPEERLIWHSR